MVYARWKSHFRDALLFAACVVCAMSLSVSFGLVQEAEGKSSPVPLIFDTDLGNDVDDALAMGVIHALQSRGECELLAVTITKDHELAAPFADAINTFYGRGEVPIGVCRSGITTHAGRFNQLARKQDNGADRYPHDLRSGNDAPSAVQVLRKTLAAAEDGSVAFVQVGFSTNLANLLDSPADEISPLTGRELIEQKGKLLSIMGGAFEKILRSDGKTVAYGEYNIKSDLPAAQKLAREWPIPVIWSGYEIGLSVPYLHESIEQDFNYVAHHPLKEAYYLHNPPPHNRPTWDLTSVLQAVRPNRGYFELSEPGGVRVNEQSHTIFTPDPEGKHRYLKLSAEHRDRVTEALILLTSQPPD